jgi:hypothetical protein
VHILNAKSWAVVPQLARHCVKLRVLASPHNIPICWQIQLQFRYSLLHALPKLQPIRGGFRNLIIMLVLFLVVFATINLLAAVAVLVLNRASMAQKWRGDYVPIAERL